jgi:hypothetical protein
VGLNKYLLGIWLFRPWGSREDLTAGVGETHQEADSVRTGHPFRQDG